MARGWLSADARLQRHLAGDARAGSWARAEARRTHQRVLKANAWLFGLFVMIVGVCGWVIGELSGMPPYVADALLGGVVVASIGSIWMFVVMSTGTAPQMMIGPGGAYVVETKWSSRRWDDDDGVIKQSRAVAQVLRSSRQLRLWHVFARQSVPVTPVVVLWGPGLREWHESTRVREIDGVHVVTGHVLADWFTAHTAGDESIDAATRTRICEAVTAQAQLRDSREAPPPLSMGQWAARGLLVLVALAACVLTISGVMRLSVVAAAFVALAWLAAGLIGVWQRRNELLRWFASGSLAAWGLMTVAVLTSI